MRSHVTRPPCASSTRPRTGAQRRRSRRPPQRVRDAYKVTDPDVDVTVDEREPAGGRVGAEKRRRCLLDAVALVPSGPIAMSPEFEGLVETSTSLGEALTEDATLTLHSLSSSSNDAPLPEVFRRPGGGRSARGRDARGEAQLRGWRPDLSSPSSPSRSTLTGGCRRGADRDRRPCRAGARRDRRQGVSGPRHALVRAADRVPALARRAGERPDRRALLEAARRGRRRDLQPGGRA